MFGSSRRMLAVILISDLFRVHLNSRTARDRFIATVLSFSFSLVMFALCDLNVR